jgi:hypothetical protein
MKNGKRVNEFEKSHIFSCSVDCAKRNMVQKPFPFQSSSREKKGANCKERARKFGWRGGRRGKGYEAL